MGVDPVQVGECPARQCFHEGVLIDGSGGLLAEFELDLSGEQRLVILSDCLVGRHLAAITEEEDLERPLAGLPSRWHKKPLRGGMVELAKKIRHLDGGHSRLEPLVSPFGSGAIDCLFESVGGEDTEGDGNPGVQSDLGETF